MLDPTLLLNILREDTMANLNDLRTIITRELRSVAGREEFARRAREMRDSYDETSAAHYRVWNSIVTIAETVANKDAR